MRTSIPDLRARASWTAVAVGRAVKPGEWSVSLPVGGLIDTSLVKLEPNPLQTERLGQGRWSLHTEKTHDLGRPTGL